MSKKRALHESAAMSKIIFILIFSLLALFNFSANAQKSEIVAYQAGLHISKNDTLPYRILYPENFDPSRQYPLVLFLHGAGERGKDNLAQLMHGSKLFVQEAFREDFPAVVLFPQCPKESYWSNVKAERDSMPYHFNFQTGGAPTKAMQLLLELLDEQKNKPYMDSSRLYVAGLSMGGMGTLELLRRRPDTFAAAIAICGGDNPANASRYADVSIWLLHGEADPVVPVHHSIAVAKQLRKLGAEVKLSTYPGVAHPSWEQAFAETDLLPWLFSKQKAGKKQEKSHHKPGIPRKK